MSSTPLPLPNTSQSLSSLSSESLLHSDDKSPQSESLSPSPRANLEFAMLIRTRKATCGWIKTVSETSHNHFLQLQHKSTHGPSPHLAPLFVFLLHVSHTVVFEVELGQDPIENA
jgi:hypothetical protein